VSQSPGRCLPYVGLLRRTLPADRPNRPSADYRSCIPCRRPRTCISPSAA